MAQESAQLVRETLNEAKMALKSKMGVGNTYDMLHVLGKIDQGKNYVLFRGSDDPTGRDHNSTIQPNELNLIDDVPLESLDFDQFPQSIQTAIREVEFTLYMGILPEINRAWVAADNKLHLWCYEPPQNDTEVFDLKHQILSVALSAPKPGVFTSQVRYILIVATSVEILLYAVMWNDVMNNFYLQPTPYVSSLDDMAMKKVVGSQTGRIFMGGLDGNLYELSYENSASSWISTFIPGAAPVDDGGEVRKCRKISHEGSLLKRFLPIFFAPEELADICIDEVRKLLWKITKSGKLEILFLGADGKQGERIGSGFNVLELAAKKGAIKYDGSFDVINIFVIPVTESKEMHAMVLLRNGVRIYLSLKNTANVYGLPNEKCFCDGQADPFQRHHIPNSLDIAYYREPPSLEAVRKCDPTAPFTSAVAGIGMPALNRPSSLNLHTAYYSHGVLLTAGSASDLNSNSSESSGDRLVGIFHTTATDFANTHEESQREGLCVIGERGLAREGKIHDIKENVAQVHYTEATKLFALFFTSSDSVNSNSGGSALAMGDLGNVGNSSASWKNLFPAWLQQPDPEPINPVMLFSPVIAYQMDNKSQIGITSSDIPHIRPLTEHVTQYLPTIHFSMQRKFLYLTNKGIYRVNKLRPVDYLYRYLAKDRPPYDMTLAFLNNFDPDVATTMCLAIVCGVPCDAGLSRSLDPTYPTPHTQLKRIKETAMNLAFHARLYEKWKQKPSYGHLNSCVVTLLSRFLMPIWNRPIVRTLQGNTGYAQNVELWTRPMVQSISNPLREIQTVLYNIAGSLLSRRNFVTGGADHVAVAGTAIGANPMQISSTGAFAESGSGGLNSVGGARIVPSGGLQPEETMLISLYHLVSRSIQALYLIDRLYVAKEAYNLRVDWSYLKNVKTFESLVLDRFAHDGMGKLLERIFEDGIKDPKKARILDELNSDLDRYAYAYFSPGNRYIVQFGNLLKEVQKEQESSISTFSRSLRAKEEKCVQLLVSAARYWTSENDVVGGQSTLFRHCESLSMLGEVGFNGIIDVCFAAAEQFGGFKTSSSFRTGSSAAMMRSVAFGAAGQGATSLQDDDTRDRAFLLRDHEKQTGVGGGLAGGGSLDPAVMENARRACYDCLLGFLIMVKHNPGTADDDRATVLFRQLVTRSYQVSEDPLYFGMLCQKLLDEGLIEELMFIPCVNYLKSKGTQSAHEILCRYFEYHELHDDASRYMEELARDGGEGWVGGEKFSLSTRINFLLKALNSANLALRAPSITERARDPMSILQTHLEDLQVSLVIAQCQQNVYDRLILEIPKIAPDKVVTRKTLEEWRDDLGNSLKEADTLIPYADRLGMWEIFLRICHALRHDSEPEKVVRAWRSIIYRCVPSSDKADLERNREFLILKRRPDRVDIDPSSKHLKMGIDREYFDRAADCTIWLQRLKSTLVPLGSQVYQPGGVAFPLEEILLELEEILYRLRLSNIPIAIGWVAECVGSMGVDKDILIRAYDSLVRSQSQESSNSRQEFAAQLLASEVHVLYSWGKVASEFSNNAEKRRLLASMRADGAAILRGLDNRLATLAQFRRREGDGQLLAKFESEARKELNDFRRICDEISLRR